MTGTAICVVALFVLLGFLSLVEAVKEVLVARATPPACPCRDTCSLTLTPGTVFDLPPGAAMPLATAFWTDGADSVERAFKRAAGEVH